MTERDDSGVRRRDSSGTDSGSDADDPDDPESDTDDPDDPESDTNDPGSDTNELDEFLRTDVRNNFPEIDTGDEYSEIDESDDGSMAVESSGLPTGTGSDEHPETEPLLSSDADDRTMVSCRQCDAEVALMADECPECGYNPARTARDAAAVILALGVVLTIAVPPVGVLALFVGVILIGWSFLRTPGSRV